jgi:hypothetical protein
MEYGLALFIEDVLGLERKQELLEGEFKNRG